MHKSWLQVSLSTLFDSFQQQQQQLLLILNVCLTVNNFQLCGNITKSTSSAEILEQKPLIL